VTASTSTQIGPSQGLQNDSTPWIMAADDKNEGGEQASCEDDKHEEEQPQEDDAEE